MPIQQSLLDTRGFNEFNRREDGNFNYVQPEPPQGTIVQPAPDRALGRESSEGMLIYDAGILRLAVGYLADSIYGIKGFNGTGTSIFELSGNLQQIAGWNFTNTVLRTGATDAASAVLIDSANSLLRLGATTGNYITLDGANLRIRSSNYSAGVSGFTVEPDLIEAENLIARGTLRGVSFKYDVVSAVGGQLLVANSDALTSDMTALDAATMTIKGDSTFAANDMLLIQAVTALGIQTEYLRVTSAASAPTYSVTRDLAGAYAADTNPIWKAGTTVVKIGVSDGAAAYSGGWLRLIGDSGVNPAPYYSVFSRTGVAYNSYAERARLGNLNGIAGKVADCYGVFLGNYSAGKYLMYDDVSGDCILNGRTLLSEPIFSDGSDGALAVAAGTTTLTRDWFATTVTVAAGATLNCAGYRVFATTSIVNDGTIHRDGNNGGNGTDGQIGAVAASPHTRIGGAAGTVTALAAGSLYGSPAVSVSGAGANMVSNTSPAANGNDGAVGTATTSTIGSNGVAGAAGGAGGNGSNGTAGSGGSAGAAGTATASGTLPRSAATAVLMIDTGSTVQQLKPAAGAGASAGGGAGGTGNDGGANDASGGAGGGGGAHGTTGGIVCLISPIITNNATGVISAVGGSGGNGGKGGDGVAGAVSPSGGGGGGGAGSGGNGGVIALFYSTYTNNGSVTVAGGTKGTVGAKGVKGGAAASDGVDGSAGTDGTTGSIITLQLR